MSAGSISTTTGGGGDGGAVTDPRNHADEHESITVEMESVTDIAGEVASELSRLSQSDDSGKSGKSKEGNEAANQLKEEVYRSLSTSEGSGSSTNQRDEALRDVIVSRFIPLIKEALRLHPTEETDNAIALVISLVRQLNSNPDCKAACVSALCNELTVTSIGEARDGNGSEEETERGEETEKEKEKEKEEEASRIRFRALTYLYSSLPFNSHLRYDVFMGLVKLAGDSNQVDSLNLLQDKKMEALAKQWGCSISELRQIYLAVSHALEQNQKLELAQHSRLAYLSTFQLAFEGDESQTTNEATPGEQLALTATTLSHARKAAIYAIKYPLASRNFNILNLEPISQLQKAKSDGNDSDPLLFELLKVFCAGNLSEYLAFVDQHPGFVSTVNNVKESSQELSLNTEECLENIRLLTLASAATEHEKLTYEQVGKLLQIDKSEVEQWVIRAISVNLIDAKMDQLAQVVVINRGTQRLFTDNQWADLGKRLQQWRASVRTLLQTVQAAQLEQDNAAQIGPGLAATSGVESISKRYGANRGGRGRGRGRGRGGGSRGGSHSGGHDGGGGGGGSSTGYTGGRGGYGSQQQQRYQQSSHPNLNASSSSSSSKGGW